MVVLTNVAQFFDTHLAFGLETVRGTGVAVDTYLHAKTARTRLSRNRIDAQGSDGDCQQDSIDNLRGTEESLLQVALPWRPLAHFEEILQGICGGTPAAGSVLRQYPIANILPGFTFEVADGQGGYITQSGVIFAEARFESEANGPLMMIASLMGTSWVEAAAGATQTVDLSERVFLHTDVVMTVEGAEYPISSFAWTLNRNVDPWHANANLPTNLVEKKATITGEFMLLPSDECRTLLQSYEADTKVKIVATYTSGANVLKFTFADVKFGNEDVDWPGLDDMDVGEQTISFIAGRDEANSTDAVLVEMTDV